MSRQLALLLCMLLIVYLFWQDRKNATGFSNAIWLPFIWVFPSCSRSFSEWVHIVTPISLDISSIEDGNPIERVLYSLLIIPGIIILCQRRTDWNAVFTNNAWIWLYFVLGAASFVWSDYPLVSFKRWIKAIGTVIMVLVILTEEYPREAIGAILRRLSFVLLPLSLLFIKYYPDLGRAYHMGMRMNTGVALQKNGLGQLCMLSAIYFSWNIFLGHNAANCSGHRLHYSIYFIILPLITWLLILANSATSLVCSIISICLFVVCRQPKILNNPLRLFHLIIVSLAIYAFLEVAFDFTNNIISFLGRRPDLTTRVPMWEDLLSLVRNSFLGAGFESFWLGERRQHMADNWGIVSQAHNGYIEMYLNMGVLGLTCILGWIASGLKKIQRHLYTDYPTAVLKLCLLLIIALANFTEASFFGASSLWLLFLFAIMDVPHGQQAHKTFNGKRD